MRGGDWTDDSGAEPGSETTDSTGAETPGKTNELKQLNNFTEKKPIIK